MEYIVDISIRNRNLKIKAESEEDAEEKVRDLLFDDSFRYCDLIINRTDELEEQSGSLD